MKALTLAQSIVAKNELKDVSELISLRLASHTNDTTDIISVLFADKPQNKKEYILLFNEFKNNQDTYKSMVKYLVLHIFQSTFKEIPLTTLISMGAETLTSHKPSTRLRLSSMVIRLLETSGAFFISTKLNMEGHVERIVKCKLNLSDNAITYLSIKARNVLNDVASSSDKAAYAGHRKKASDNNDHMSHLTNKLNNVAYIVSERVWDKFKVRLASYRFTHKHVQLDMIQTGDDLVGQTLHFEHRFGADNGRVYCDGDLFTLHGGALNYIYKFADKRMLTPQGLEDLETRINSLKAQDTICFKEEVELYSLQCDLLDHLKGLPVGCILHQDAKLSGLQHQATAVRSKNAAVYCGMLDTLKDGYDHIRESLSNKDALSRDMVKKAYNPYQYGAGAKTVIEAVEKEGGTLDFEEWSEAYQAAFPAAFRLREFLLMLSKEYKSEYYRFKSPSGFNCVITALGNEEDIIVTNYGKLTYSRREVNTNHMGVKLVAAFSHMQDASSLHHVVDKAQYDMHVIHDSFGSHPNDARDVNANYVDSLRTHLAQPVLKNFVTQVVQNRTGSDLVASLWEADVSALMENTLTPSDITKGLY